MYSLGIDHCDNMLMLLGACKEMDPADRDIVLVRMMKGFSDTAQEAGTRVTGGQTVINAWPLIGGVAMTAAQESDFIRPESTRPQSCRAAPRRAALCRACTTAY